MSLYFIKVQHPRGTYNCM